MKGFLQHIQQFVSSQFAPSDVGASPEEMAGTFQIHSYGQQNSGLTVEEIQPIMQWVSCSIYMGTQYTGKSHLFWLLPDDDFRQDFQRLHRRGDMILGYRCGNSMAPAPDGLYWRMVEDHPSLRIYQLEAQEA